MNVIHVRLGTAFAQADLENMSLILKVWWDAYMKALTNTATSLTSIEATSLELEDDLRVQFGTGLPLAGTNATDALPGGTTLAIRFASAYSGRSKNGRWFLAGMSENQVSGNQVVAGVVTLLQAAFEELLAAIGEYGNNAGLVIVSYCNNGAWRTTGATTLVENVLVNPYVDSQRRRNKR